VITGIVTVAVAGWVLWSRHQHKKPLKPLHTRHHFHWHHKDAK
jgi:hypothetical protein